MGKRHDESSWRSRYKCQVSTSKDAHITGHRGNAERLKERPGTPVRTVKMTEFKPSSEKQKKSTWKALIEL
jgi:hypothetical protein